MTPSIEQFRVDTLVLLVGRNPLPNAVSGRLLLKEDGRAVLIHSKDTADVAMRLTGWIEKKVPRAEVQTVQVDESNPEAVFQGVLSAMGNVPLPRSVGLNYTGGTKAMSVHAYRAAEQWSSQNNRPCTFSYLDARGLRMVVDRFVPNGETLHSRPYVGLGMQLSFEHDLMELHNRTLRESPRPRTKAVLPETAAALARVFSNQKGEKAWHDWKTRLDKFRDTSKKGNPWKATLKGEFIEFSNDPLLSEVTETMKKELGVSGIGCSLSKAADSCGFVGYRVLYFYVSPESQFLDWLHGQWLEHYVLSVLEASNQEPFKLSLHYKAINIETEPTRNSKTTKFELDVAILRGYQLFAVSCSTVSGTKLLKQKLFEAYVRARQLGGEEARVALVCTTDTDAGLQDEINSDFETGGQIKVFGRKSLLTLGENIAKWIETQIGSPK